MTFTATTNAGALAKAAAMAARVSPRASQTTAPILSNVRLQAGSMGLEVDGTDLDRRVQIVVEAKAAGVVTVSAERLAAISQTLDPAGDVKLELKDAMLAVTQGRAKLKLATLPPKDFPPASISPREPVVFTCASPPLIEAIGAVTGAVDTDSLRQYLNGALFDFSGRTPMLVGTDGQILSASPIPFIDKAKPPQVIVPLSSLANVSAVAGLAEISTLRISETGFAIEAAGVRFETKVIDATPVEWRRVVRKVSPTIVKVATADMDRVIRRTLAAGLRTLILSFGETCTSSGEAVNGDNPNAADDEFAALDVIGEPVTTAIQTQFARWAISTFKGAEALEFSLLDKTDAVEIRNPAGDPDDVRVIMPIRSSRT